MSGDQGQIGGLFNISGSATPYQKGLTSNAQQAFQAGSTVLKQIVNPGDVTDLQKAAIKEETTKEQSAWDAYLTHAGLSSAADNFDASGLVQEQALAQQFDWSQMDLQNALNMLGVSATSALEESKLQLGEEQATGQAISGAASIFASIFSMA